MTQGKNCAVHLLLLLSFSILMSLLFIAQWKAMESNRNQVIYISKFNNYVYGFRCIIRFLSEYVFFALRCLETSLLSFYDKSGIGARCRLEQGHKT